MDHRKMTLELEAKIIVLEDSFPAQKIGRGMTRGSIRYARFAPGILSGEKKIFVLFDVRKSGRTLIHFSVVHEA